MGTGIMAAIPLTFRAHDRFRIEEANFTEKFFDNYDIFENEGKKKYVIKKDLLLVNYMQFLKEFHSLIEDDSFEEPNFDSCILKDSNSLDDFIDVFKGKNRNNSVPFIYESPFMFSVLGCVCEKYWLFYSGSYKAILEEYSTLLHFEKILAKAMRNPLAHAIKFGIFG